MWTDFYLVGGFNPFEEYYSQNGSSLQVRVKIKDIWNQHLARICQFLWPQNSIKNLRSPKGLHHFRPPAGAQQGREIGRSQALTNQQRHVLASKRPKDVLEGGFGLSFLKSHQNFFVDFRKKVGLQHNHLKNWLFKHHFLSYLQIKPINPGRGLSWGEQLFNLSGALRQARQGDRQR